ncbi:hypothetical protein MIZ03_0133 [Rhodoferax lithotrophicus]|uniref:Uncharacterized protein n=1 Tax=Rhodoferax lithotrophicus TaxID=2798804 RepID=A0ABN6D1B4_9BURK|nr:hypothetical protein [Rhodoferax sp. MIZ03]BCO25273.1 hypothetical protein MIZ03_0133 [Rhodoferax sp. MIZ03]
MHNNLKMQHQDIPSALKWIVEVHYPMHVKEKRHTIRIEAGKDSVTAVELAINENIVTIADAGMTFWYRPYSEPGAPSFAGMKLNGLFDFLRVVIWPKMTDGWSTERFLIEPQLNEVEQSAVSQYNAFQAEDKRLNLADIDNLLRGHPHLQRLYAAIRTKDIIEIHVCEAHFAREPSQISTEYIRKFSSAIEAGNTEAADSQKAFLIYLILTAAAETLSFEDQLNWHSLAYDENSTKLSEQRKHINRLANQWNIRAFERLCLSEDMLKINDLFSSDRDGYMAHVSAFVAELAA